MPLSADVLEQAFYWGTSEWSAFDIEAAHREFVDPMTFIVLTERGAQMLLTSLV